MTKKRLIIIGFVMFFCLQTAVFAQDEESQELNLEGKNFIEMYNEINKLEKNLSQAEIDLKFLTDGFESESQKKIASQNEEKTLTQTRLDEIAARIKEIDYTVKTADNRDALATERKSLVEEQKSSQEKIKLIDEELVKLAETKNQEEVDYKNKVAEKEQEINTLNANIEKAKQITWDEFVSTMTRMLLYFTVALVVIFGGRFTKRTISRHATTLAPKRKEVLYRIINITTWSIVVLTIVAALFSQFVTMLPFLALLGTGLAFAVRDVISSFLGWFFIGMKHGYKVGDLIEVDGDRGRVKDIHLIHTVLRETGQRGPTGRILLIPNNIIFQETLKNFSAMYRYSWVIIDFYLEQGTNVQKMKKILLEISEKHVKTDLEDISKNLPALFTKFGLTEKNIQPEVIIELDPMGIKVKLRVFCRLDNRHSARTAISEEFLERIQTENDIKLHFADSATKSD